MKSWKMILTIAIGAAFLATAAAQAADLYFDDTASGGAADMDWDNAANWWTDSGHTNAAGVVPTASESVRIDSAVELGTGNGICESIEMPDGISVFVDDGSGGARTLTIAGNGQTSNLGSTAIIHLDVSGSKLLVSDDHTLAGSGEVRGTNANALVTIADSKTLTLEANITGTLQIVDESMDQASFVNRGKVEADGGNLLLVDVHELDDTAGDRWQATAASSVLKFASTISTITGGNLEGNLRISGSDTAEIEVGKALTTTGRLDMTNGVLDVDANLTMGSSSKLMDMSSESSSTPDIEVAAGAEFAHLGS
jgi:hypothetical protein